MTRLPRFHEGIIAADVNVRLSSLESQAGEIRIIASGDDAKAELYDTITGRLVGSVYSPYARVEKDRNSALDVTVTVNLRELDAELSYLNLSDVDRHRITHHIAEYLDRRNVVQFDSKQTAPSLEDDEIPNTASVKWTERKAGDTPGTFITENYGKYFGRLTTADLDRLDHTLNVAYGRWIRKLFEENTILPPGFPLPTNGDRLNGRDAAISDEEVKNAQNLLARYNRQKKRTQKRDTDTSHGL